AWQQVLRAQAALLPEGPSPAERARHRRGVPGGGGGRGRAGGGGAERDAGGRRAAARLSTPDSYGLTATAAVAAVAKVLGGLAPAGFQTPAGIFGADFVLPPPGVGPRDAA